MVFKGKLGKYMRNSPNEFKNGKKEPKNEPNFLYFRNIKVNVERVNKVLNYFRSVFKKELDLTSERDRKNLHSLVDVLQRCKVENFGYDFVHDSSGIYSPELFFEILKYRTDKNKEKEKERQKNWHKIRNKSEKSEY